MKSDWNAIYNLYSDYLELDHANSKFPDSLMVFVKEQVDFYQQQNTYSDAFLQTAEILTCAVDEIKKHLTQAILYNLYDQLVFIEGHLNPQYRLPKSSYCFRFTEHGSEKTLQDRLDKRLLPDRTTNSCYAKKYTYFGNTYKIPKMLQAYADIFTLSSPDTTVQYLSSRYLNIAAGLIDITNTETENQTILSYQPWAMKPSDWDKIARLYADVRQCTDNVLSCPIAENLFLEKLFGFQILTKLIEYIQKPSIKEFTACAKAFSRLVRLGYTPLHEWLCCKVFAWVDKDSDTKKRIRKLTMFEHAVSEFFHPFCLDVLCSVLESIVFKLNAESTQRRLELLKKWLAVCRGSMKKLSIYKETIPSPHHTAKYKAKLLFPAIHQIHQTLLYRCSDNFEDFWQQYPSSASDKADDKLEFQQLSIQDKQILFYIASVSDNLEPIESTNSKLLWVPKRNFPSLTFFH